MQLKLMTSFSGGPAGTGKPFSRGDGSSSFKKAKYKIILTRPAVEAGESLELLPGDLKKKSILIYVQFTMPCIKFLVWIIQIV